MVFLSSFVIFYTTSFTNLKVISMLRFFWFIQIQLCLFIVINVHPNFEEVDWIIKFQELATKLGRDTIIFSYKE